MVPPSMFAAPVRSRTSQYVVLGVAVLAAVAALAGWWYATQYGAQIPLESAGDLAPALASTTPAMSADVAAETTVEIDSTEQTNPFNDDYINPFE